jgi:hypothetical protein
MHCDPPSDFRDWILLIKFVVTLSDDRPTKTSFFVRRKRHLLADENAKLSAGWPA